MMLISLNIPNNYKCEEDDYIVYTKTVWNRGNLTFCGVNLHINIWMEIPVSLLK